MSDFEVTTLGNNSSLPVHGRFPSAQVVGYGPMLYLVDCGEGTQIRLSEYGIKRSRIDRIFISHLHGDHVYGLPGLINSYAHVSRSGPLHIYGPKGIRQMMDTILRLSESKLLYDIEYHELTADSMTRILDEGNLRVHAFPLRHRVKTYGFKFGEKDVQPRLDKEAVKKHNIPVRDIIALKERRITPAQLNLPDDILRQDKARCYAYCSDTVYDTSLVPWISAADLLYHEATFLQELEEKALETTHSTAFQAGMIARMADVGRLLIGHFSSRYTDLQPLLEEAQEVFPDTELALEGRTYQVGS